MSESEHALAEIDRLEREWREADGRWHARLGEVQRDLREVEARQQEAVEAGVQQAIDYLRGSGSGAFRSAASALEDARRWGLLGEAASGSQERQG
jgi:hypothetical protein